MKANCKTNSIRVILSLALVVLLAFSACGAPGHSGQKGDLMANVKPRSPSAPALDLNGAGADASAEFGLKLLRASLAEDGGNVLVSPLSVLSALVMTAGGASGDTLAQMEAALGLPAEQLREWLWAYSQALPSAEKVRFHQANSLWLREGGVEVEKDFLQQNADYFGAEVYQRPFDSATLEEINRWVSEHTFGMIPRILQELQPEAMLVLANALAFDGEWAEVYEDNQVQERWFDREDGTGAYAVMMCSTEFSYLQDGEAVGFCKPYAGGDYAFAALLPPEGETLADYAESLSGERLREILQAGENRPVLAGLPKFETEYGAQLNGLLQAMGVTNAFDPEEADFSRMGRAAGGQPLYIGQVLHKTHLSVFEQGSKAGAATAVVMEAGGAMLDEPVRVYLDRPFLYMIVDRKTDTPIFLGAMLNPV